VLAEPASPSYVRWALEQCGNPDDFHVAVFSVLCVDDDRARAYRTMAPWLASLLTDPHVGLRVLPFFDDLVARHDTHGVSGLATMPSEWWSEIGPIGTADDAVAHVEALKAAGVQSIGMFPAPVVETAMAQVDDVLRIAAR
ncbi:MAG: LLM class flavin-dependent oxidoreductase, partial [Jiangellaceae bacterium]